MVTTRLAGTRIRERRQSLKIKQADLAGTCGISASYLNLIEHNRRRIGGGLLVSIARALETDPSLLNDGIDDELRTSLEAAADANSGALAERDRAEEFAGRFPGWARLIALQRNNVARLEQVVESLDDRLAHDPFLSASLHAVISSVTAIRSASAILADGGKIEPEWQARFHRNIYEDSQRLTETAETLAGYLSEDADTSRQASLPQDEIQSWLEARSWQFAELESDPRYPANEILDGAKQLKSQTSKTLGRKLLKQYAEDALALPLKKLIGSVQANPDPVHVADSLSLPLPVVFRRLAAIGPGELERPFGLVGCDSSGAWVFRKPIPGFEIPRYGNGCPLWPLFRSMLSPQLPIRARIAVSTRDEYTFFADAIAEISHPKGHGSTPVVFGWMIVRETQVGDRTPEEVRVGISCRICSEKQCPSRREPSVFSREQ